MAVELEFPPSVMRGELQLGAVVEITCYWTENTDYKVIIIEKERLGLLTEQVFFKIENNIVSQTDTDLFPEFSAKLVLVPQNTYASHLLLRLLGATEEDTGIWRAVVIVSGVEHKSSAKEMIVNGECSLFPS